jgi:hypothetical protein
LVEIPTASADGASGNAASDGAVERS